MAFTFHQGAVCGGVSERPAASVCFSCPWHAAFSPFIPLRSVREDIIDGGIKGSRELCVQGRAKWDWYVERLSFVHLFLLLSLVFFSPFSFLSFFFLFCTLKKRRLEVYVSRDCHVFVYYLICLLFCFLFVFFLNCFPLVYYWLYFLVCSWSRGSWRFYHFVLSLLCRVFFSVCIYFDFSFVSSQRWKIRLPMKFLIHLLIDWLIESYT